MVGGGLKKWRMKMNEDTFCCCCKKEDVDIAAWNGKGRICCWRCFRKHRWAAFEKESPTVEEIKEAFKQMLSTQKEEV